MQCAMELLQQLYVDVTEKTGHMITRTQFRQLTQRLVSHSRKKCLKEDGQSQQYKKEILLMLTCLKVMLESEREEEILQGKKEDTESENKKTTAAIVQPLFEELVAVDIMSVLLNLIDDQDKLISYAAHKALTAAVRCDSLSERRETLIQDILSRVTGCDPSSRVAPFLNLLVHFMSNRSGEQINTWCLHTLMSSEIFRKEFLENIFTNVDKKSIDKPVALLTLLQKSVKYMNKLDKEQKQKYLQVMISTIQEDLLLFLISCLQSVSLSHWRILCKRTLDIFQTLFNYGSHLAQQKEILSLYSQTASRVLSAVCPTVTSIPYIHEFVGFGGSLVEKSDDEDCQGDLSLIRKLLLVLLKSCAILMRTKTSCSVSDRDQVSMCLVSLMQLMTKILPSTHCHADFQWLPLVFADQDDAWVEALLCLLDVYLNSPRLSSTSGICSQTNPHPLFLQFLNSNSSDHMVIVDLLTSPETCFLLYFLRYLKCVVCEWDQFTDTCHRMFPHKHSRSKKRGSSDSTDSSPKGISENSELSSIQDENVLAENNIDFCTPATKKIRLNSAWQDQEKNTFRSCERLTKNNVVSTGTGGLVCLTVYSDSESSDEEDSSSVYLATKSIEPSHNNLDKSKSYCDHSDRDENKTSKLTAFSQDNGFIKLDSFFSYCDHSPHGSIESCDLQCVEIVLGTFIRVRLRIERLSEQKLFPYNPDPLLTLLEHCETLYENMEPGAMQ